MLSFSKILAWILCTEYGTFYATEIIVLLRIPSLLSGSIIIANCTRYLEHHSSVVAEIYRNTSSRRFVEQDASLTRHTTRQHISASFPFLVTEIHRDMRRRHVDTLYNASTRVNTSTRPGTYQFFLFRVRVSPLPPLRRNSACALQHLTYLPFVISDQPSAFSFIM